MIFPSNAHTHSRWCDGVDTIFDMVEAARALGFVSLGFSGHAGQGFDPAYSMAPDAQASYFAQLRALQAAPEPGFPRLWAGLEVDALAHEDLRRADYAAFSRLTENLGKAHGRHGTASDDIGKRAARSDWRKLVSVPDEYQPARRLQRRQKRVHQLYVYH